VLTSPKTLTCSGALLGYRRERGGGITNEFLGSVFGIFVFPLRCGFRPDLQKKENWRFSRQAGKGGSSDMRKSQLRVPSSEGSPLKGAARMFEHETILRT
jgi:hypothetical protein